MYNRLSGKIRLPDDLLCVEWDVKPYWTLTPPPHKLPWKKRTPDFSIAMYSLQVKQPRLLTDGTKLIVSTSTWAVDCRAREMPWRRHVGSAAPWRASTAPSTGRRYTSSVHGQTPTVVRCVVASSTSKSSLSRTASTASLPASSVTSWSTSDVMCCPSPVEWLFSRLPRKISEFFLRK